MDARWHAERVTGQKQFGLVDLWSSMGFAAALSEVTGPRVYDYGTSGFSTVAIMLYDVRRHVLIEDGRVRRDAPVRSGRFRIAPPGRNVVVDAVPEVVSGKLVLLYLDDRLFAEAGAAFGRGAAIELKESAWDTDDSFLAEAARRLAEASAVTCPGHSLFGDAYVLFFAAAYALPETRGRVLHADA